jgi:hypothetical protein
MELDQEHRDILARVQSIGRTPFEHFVADIFSEAGWEAEATQRSNDGGIDVEAKQDGWISKKAVIQAKRKNPGNKVERPDVQQYHSLKITEENADIVGMATTTCFTSGAYNYSREHNIKLIDGSVFAGFVISRGCMDILEKYEREGISSEIDTSESFNPQREPREQFYSEQPVSHAAQMLSNKELIDVVDMVQDVEVGRERIEALYILEDQLRSHFESPPMDPIEDYPQIIDQNWYTAEISDEMAAEAKKKAEFSGDPPESAEELCVKHNRGVAIIVALPPNHDIGRAEFAYVTDLGDYLMDTEYVPRENEVTGIVIGNKIGEIERQLDRHPQYRAETYQRLIERGVAANEKLLEVVRPFFKSSDPEMVEKINRLRAVNTKSECDTTEEQI